VFLFYNTWAIGGEYRNLPCQKKFLFLLLPMSMKICAYLKL
jgi:hypothetical protein